MGNNSSDPRTQGETSTKETKYQKAVRQMDKTWSNLSDAEKYSFVVYRAIECQKAWGKIKQKPNVDQKDI